MTTGNPPSAVPPFPGTVPFDPAIHLNFLDAIQGNILKSHGRKHTRLVFFRFQSTRVENRQLLAAALKVVTSAGEQYRQARSGKRNHPFYGLALTDRFFDSALYDRQDPAVEPVIDSTDRERRRTSEQGDWWELPYWDKPDGLWLLAHDRKARLDRMQLAIETLLADHGAASYAAPENGFLWYDKEPDAAGQRVFREPFGFRDGISNAQFLTESGRVLTPTEEKRVQLPLDQVFIGPQGLDPDALGLVGSSFMTLAKFEQDVAAFLDFEKKMKSAAEAAGVALPADAATPIIGRQRDGTPYGVPPGANLNDFEYTNGRANRGCPFHAHIRKSNPRADDSNHAGDATGKTAQFIRRSVVYDKFGQLPRHAAPRYPAGPKIKGHLGLLFMGYMSNVSEQFETLFNNWYRDPGFPYSTTGVKDVLLRGGTEGNKTWQWDNLTVPEMPRFVRNRGVLQLFVPSLSWLSRQ